MNDEAIAELVREMNAVESPRAVLYVAGGGTEVFRMILAQGGGSNTLLGARIPYAPEDFRDAIGADPGRFVDARAARALAMAAFRHALKVRGDLPAEEVIGIGSTSKLSRGEGEREGRSHEIHATIQSADSTRSWSITLPAGRGRAWEERINALVLLNILATWKVGGEGIPLEHDGQGVPREAISHQAEGGEPSIVGLLVGRRPWVALELPPEPVFHEAFVRASEDAEELERVLIPGRPQTRETDEPPRLLLPGSFRPLHEGHVAMAEAASRMLGLPCGYEISLFHPEKPPLDYITIRSRLSGFEGHRCRIYLTNAPTYVEKARLFPGCTFVVGHDTALRIVDPRFYGGSAGRDAALDELERLGARFLVFGRVDASGEFHDFSPDDFEQPAAGFLGRVATPVPGQVFRLDVSSTEVRRRSGRDFD